MPGALPRPGPAQRGEQVALLARRLQLANSAAADAGGGALALQCNVTDEVACAAAIDEAPLDYNANHDFYALSRFDDVETAMIDWDTYRSGQGSTLEMIKANARFRRPPPARCVLSPPTSTPPACRKPNGAPARKPPASASGSRSRRTAGR